MNSTPSIMECEDDYQHDSHKHSLQWNWPIVDANNKTGAMEFSVPASIPADFLPLEVSFVSQTPYADLRVADVVAVDG